MSIISEPISAIEIENFSLEELDVENYVDKYIPRINSLLKKNSYQLKIKREKSHGFLYLKVQEEDPYIKLNFFTMFPGVDRNKLWGTFFYDEDPEFRDPAYASYPLNEAWTGEMTQEIVKRYKKQGWTVKSNFVLNCDESYRHYLTAEFHFIKEVNNET